MSPLIRLFEMDNWWKKNSSRSYPHFWLCFVSPFKAFYDFNEKRCPLVRPSLGAKDPTYGSNNLIVILGGKDPT